MTLLLTILIILVSILLVLVVFVQKSKGGGLDPSVGSNQALGARRSTEFIEKLTWGLMISLASLCIISSVMNQSPSVSSGSDKESVIQQGAEEGAPASTIQADDLLNDVPPASSEGDASETQSSGSN